MSKYSVYLNIPSLQHLAGFLFHTYLLLVLCL